MRHEKGYLSPSDFHAIIGKNRLRLQGPLTAYFPYFYLIILRVQELVMHTITANKGKAPWADVPVFVGAHDYENLIFVMH
ncbi:hypothetical protein [uncultured Chitinophaga sp.]|uniref:hypothetical protein n=1 Tax=uncultured Chitinophaga sp. TaxID=339340 RepID=UPI0025D9AAB0|nr:hypothetical protein [uncultured Chitinophaga sp.]